MIYVVFVLFIVIGYFSAELMHCAEGCRFEIIHLSKAYQIGKRIPRSSKTLKTVI